MASKNVDDLRALYMEKGKEVVELGEAIEVAQESIEIHQEAVREAKQTVSDKKAAHQQARAELAAVVADYGEDPFNLLSIGQPKSAPRPAGSTGRAGRGKNQQAIMEAVSGASEGLTQAAILEKVKASLGGGSDASIIQATGKLFKDGAIRRTGKRRSYLYFAA